MVCTKLFSEKRMNLTGVFCSVLFLVLFFNVNDTLAADAIDSRDDWQFEFTLYGWLPSVDTTLKYDVPPSEGDEVTVDASDILDAIDLVFMGIFEARHKKLSLAADVVYLDVSNTKNTDIIVGPDPGQPLNVNAGLGLTAWTATGSAGYDVVQTNKFLTAIIGGVRYLSLSTDVDITINGAPPANPPPGYLSGSKDFWDAIVGVKGGYKLGKHWYVPYYADIGAGESQLTWQVYTGIGYQFSWGDLKLAYRHLEYDQDDKLLQELKLSGPQLGIGFKF
jgi:hypothetical protein